MILLLETLSSLPVHAAQIKDPLLTRVREKVHCGWQATSQMAIHLYQTRASEFRVQDSCLLWGSHIIISPQGRLLFVCSTKVTLTSTE